MPEITLVALARSRDCRQSLLTSYSSMRCMAQKAVHRTGPWSLFRLADANILVLTQQFHWHKYHLHFNITTSGAALGLVTVAPLMPFFTNHSPRPRVPISEHVSQQREAKQLPFIFHAQECDTFLHWDVNHLACFSAIDLVMVTALK